MLERLKRLYRRWSEIRELSWVSHLGQGYLMGLVFAWLTFGVGSANGLDEWQSYRMAVWAGFVSPVSAFGHREVSDAADAWEEGGWRAAWQKVRNDGIADFFAPYVGGLFGALSFVTIRELVGLL